MNELFECVGRAITDEYGRWKQRFENQDDGTIADTYVTIYRENDDGTSTDSGGAVRFRKFELEVYKEFGRLRRDAVAKKAIEAGTLHFPFPRASAMIGVES